MKYAVLLYWKMNEDTTCTRCSALMKARNAHICCKLWLVGFKTKGSPNYTVSSQEKNWFLEEGNGVMAEHGSLNYNYRVSWKERELHRWMHFVIILTILVLFRYLISTSVNFSPQEKWELLCRKHGKIDWDELAQWLCSDTSPTGPRWVELATGASRPLSDKERLGTEAGNGLRKGTNWKI